MNPGDAIALTLMVGGGFFLLVGSVGIVRLPDFYTRIHAAAKSDTLGLMLMMIGLAVHEGLTITSAKLLIVIAFVVITNPVGAHALARAAYVAGLRPWFPGSAPPPDPTEPEPAGEDA